MFVSSSSFSCSYIFFLYLFFRSLVFFFSLSYHGSPTFLFRSFLSYHLITANFPIFPLRLSSNTIYSSSYYPSSFFLPSFTLSSLLPSSASSARVASDPTKDSQILPPSPISSTSLRKKDSSK